MARLASMFVFGLLQCLLVISVVVTLVFVVSRLTSDPITVAVPLTATTEEIEHLKDAAGLNDPLVEQYWRFVKDVVRLDFGTSFRTNQPALHEVMLRVPKTLELGATALLFSIVVGVSVGVLAAVKRGTPIDYFSRLLALIGQAVPSFWLGLMFIYFFAVELSWLPTGGIGGLNHLVLPALTLSMGSMAAISRLTRGGMLDVLQSDFVRTARAKGLAEQTVIWRHALRNALMPVVTVMGLQVGRLIAGAIVVETVFAWPGLGRLMISSITTGDYPVVQTGVILISASIVLANLIVDLSYQIIDPRIRDRAA